MQPRFTGSSPTLHGLVGERGLYLLVRVVQMAQAGKHSLALRGLVISSLADEGTVHAVISVQPYL